MSGKSTYMRQSAIISLMAHIGSFVPADYADIPIMDRIFTRVGASDDLSQGQSTFMVEMTEVSLILQNATEKSLVILDEIGRGTSTYDGISLAWSIVEYIQKNIKCKTLFATHYHELTDLENEFEDVKNYSIAVKDDGDGIVFLRKIIPQGADKSYGIYVAELAKLPAKVINRAKDILKDLEQNHIYNASALNRIAITSDNEHISSKGENASIKKDKQFVVQDDQNSVGKTNLDPVNQMERELEKINNDNIKIQYDTLKKEFDMLLKETKQLKKNVIKDNNPAQISFDNIGKDDVLANEISSLDILNMTPLDAMSALYNLQKKAKEINS